jgi:nicotinamide mononucleotide (NMN) deamidase PncC
VFLALDREDAAPVVQRLALDGDRETIRRDTVAAGLHLLLSALPKV